MYIEPEEAKQTYVQASEPMLQTESLEQRNRTTGNPSQQPPPKNFLVACKEGQKVQLDQIRVVPRTRLIHLVCRVEAIRRI